jgi:glycerol-3-phosphate O-acyltransferase
MKSTLLFATARPSTSRLRDRRAAFRSEIRGILVDLDTVESLAREQFVERAS